MDGQHEDKKLKKLASASDLKGGKAPSEGKKTRKSMLVPIIAMVVVLGLAVGAYYASGWFKPAEDPAAEATAAPSTTVKLVSRTKAEVDSVTVTQRGQEPYTLQNNVTYDAEGTAIGTKVDEEAMAAKAEAEAAAETAAPEATTEAAAKATAKADPKATAEATPEATTEATPEVTAEAVPEATADSGEATPEDDTIYLAEYTVSGKTSFDLDQSVASSMLGYCANMTATKLVAENVTDVSMYGLADPSVKILMKYRDGSVSEWYLGDKVPTSTSYYIMEKGANNVFMIYSTVYTTFSRSLPSLHVVQMPMTIADYTKIRSVTIEQRDQETVELQYGTEIASGGVSISSLKLTQPFIYDAHSERGDAMLQAAAALTVTSYAGTVDELPEAKLDDPRAIITVVVEDVGTLKMTVGEFDASGENYYVKIDDSDNVYLAEKSVLALLDNAKASYLVDQFSNLVYINRVDKLTVTTPDDEYTLAVNREPELDENGEQVMGTNNQPKTIDTYFFDGEEKEEDLFKKLYQEIIGTLVSKVSDDRDIRGDVVAKVIYELNVEPNEFTVEYLTYDDEYYAVRRDDMTLFLIKKDKVEAMLTALSQYREGTFVAD